MPAYLTPGVYRRPQLAVERDIRLVRTDVAGFVGFTERGPLAWPNPDATRPDIESVAIQLTSWKEFVATFGEFIKYGYLAYAIRAFFENGGQTCYVVRVAALNTGRTDTAPRKAFLPLPGARVTYPNSREIPILASDANAGDSTLSTQDDVEGKIFARDLIELAGGGLTESVAVISCADKAIALSTKLANHYKAGTPIEKYKPGLIATATGAIALD